MKLKVKYLKNYASEWPRLGYAKSDDAGMDLRAAIAEPVILQPGQRLLVPNGISCQMEDESTAWEIQIRPRSGLAAKYGISIVNSPGTIDWGYRGELITILLNTGSEPFEIKPGDRISQMVICPIMRPVIEIADALDETPRGGTGFGSSGH